MWLQLVIQVRAFPVFGHMFDTESFSGNSHLKRSKEETSSQLLSDIAQTTGPPSLSAALTLIQPKNPSSVTIPAHPQLSTKEVIKRLGPGDPVQEMPLAEQYSIAVDLLRKKEMKIGEVWYLVDKGWWDSWIKASNNSTDPRLVLVGIRYTMETIDNSSLIDSSTGDLRKELVAIVDKFREVRGPARGDGLLRSLERSIKIAS